MRGEGRNRSHDDDASVEATTALSETGIFEGIGSGTEEEDEDDHGGQDHASLPGDHGSCKPTQDHPISTAEVPGPDSTRRDIEGGAGVVHGFFPDPPQ